MPLQIALGPYKATVVKDLTPLAAPNPRCCSDPGVLCGNCAALVLRQAGYGTTCNEEQGDDDLDEDDDEDSDWEEVRDEDDDLDDDEPFFEETEMTRNIDKGKLTYVGLPSEMTAGQTLTANRQPLTCNACPEAKKSSSPLCLNCSCKNSGQPEQTVKRSRSGIPLTFVPCPGEEGKQR